jgi:undecaprenyl diphosphate synthase
MTKLQTNEDPDLIQLFEILKLSGPLEADQLKKAEEKTKDNAKTTLILALSYSGRWDIIEAMKKIGNDIKDGKIQPNEVNDTVVSAALNTAQYPDPDLLIRTSGEQRISNFLLWEIAYSEVYFTDVLWPDFTKNHFLYYEKTPTSNLFVLFGKFVCSK